MAAERQSRLSHSLIRVPINDVTVNGGLGSNSYLPRTRHANYPKDQAGHRIIAAIQDKRSVPTKSDYAAPPLMGSTQVGGLAPGQIIGLPASMATAAATSPQLGDKRSVAPASPLVSPPTIALSSERTDRGIATVEQHIKTMARQSPSTGRAMSNANGLTKERIVTVAERRGIRSTSLGLPIGGFTFLPSFDLAMLAQSNPRRSSRASGDVGVEIIGQAELRSNWGRHSLALAGKVENRAYAKFSSENATQWNVKGTGVLDVVDRSSVKVEGGYGHYVVQRGATGEVLQTARPVTFDRKTAKTTAAFVGTHVGATLTGEIDQRDYQDARTPSGALSDQQFRDVTRKSLGLSAEMLGKPGSAAFLSLERAWFDYRVNLGTNRNSTQTSLMVGYRGDITPVIRGTIAAGLFRLDFKNPSIPQTTKPAINAQVDWTVTPLTTVSLSVSREVNGTADPRGVSQILTAYALGADHELRRNLIVSASVTRTLSDYQGAPGQDRVWRERLNARWIMNSHMSMDTILDGEQRPNSLQSATGYKAYSLRTRFRYAF